VAQGQVGLSPPPLTLLPGNGDGTFGFGKSIPSNNTAVDVAAADFNGDGKTDLVAAAEPPGSAGGNVVEVFFGNGDGTFQPEIDTIVHLPSLRSIAVGDFNHDGKTDVAVAGEGSTNFTGVVAVLLGNGDGTFQPETDYAVGDGPTSITVADLNADAIPDLVVASQGSNSVFTLLSNGDGSFQTPASWGLTAFPRSRG
jgi:hypothetical protein